MSVFPLIPSIQQDTTSSPTHPQNNDPLTDDLMSELFAEVIPFSSQSPKKKEALPQSSPSERPSTRTSAELFFEKVREHGCHTPFTPDTPFSCPSRNTDLNASPELSIQDVDTLMQGFATNHELSFPHHTVRTPFQCQQLFVQLIKDAYQKPFDARNPLENRCTVISTLSGSSKKDLLADVVHEHKTTFYLERTAPIQFALVSFDSIEAHTPRRLMQAIRTSLETSPSIELDTYRVTPCRQYNYNGCGVFSVHDVLECHHTTNLIEQLKALPCTKVSDHDRNVISPPAFMTPTQSFTTLTTYMSQVEPVLKTQPWLQEGLQKLTTQVFANTKQGEIKHVNTYLQELFLEYSQRLHHFSNETPLCPSARQIEPSY